MSIEHTIRGEVVELAIAGHFSLDELLGGFRAALGDPDLPPGAGLVIDVTASEEVPPADVMTQIADIIRAHRARLGPRLAVLVSAGVRFGRARQLGAWLANADVETRPFWDREEALTWLSEG